MDKPVPVINRKKFFFLYQIAKNKINTIFPDPRYPHYQRELRSEVLHPGQGSQRWLLTIQGGLQAEQDGVGARQVYKVYEAHGVILSCD
jgi:hypothetical protein